MKIHVHAEIAPWCRPLVPDGSIRSGTEDMAIRAAVACATLGHDVTFQGGGWRGEHGGVSFLLDDDEAPASDLLLCVKGRAPQTAARARIFYSHGIEQPEHGGWSAIVAVSAYHAELLRRRFPEERVVVITAGSTPPPAAGTASRDRFLYASSPDRGLHHLLRMWPAMWSEFGRPLSITYDLRAVLRRTAHLPGRFGDRMRDIAARIDQPGIVVHGALDRADLGRLQLRSLALPYPLDPLQPYSELYALSVMEACAAGVAPVLSPVDCFPSVYADVATFVDGYDTADWLAAIRGTIVSPGASERARAFAALRTEEHFVDDWSRLLSDPRTLESPLRTAWSAC